MAVAVVEILKLPPVKAKELRREAEHEGISPEQYVKHLVESHLDRVKRIRNTSFFDLAAPIRAALKGLSEEEIDAMVKRARGRRRAKKASRRRE